LAFSLVFSACAMSGLRYPDAVLTYGIAGRTALAVGGSKGIGLEAARYRNLGGLVREVFFHGFQVLGADLERLGESGDPRADLIAAIEAFRMFVRANPVLAEVMFSRPVADFQPGPDEVRAGAAVREFVVGRVGRCVDAGIVAGDPVDIAHVLLAAAQGLAAQETAGWLGSSKTSVDRRWALGIRAVLDGLKPA
jgi:Tetracyclin repressor-like, C-terminal domain